MKRVGSLITHQCEEIRVAVLQASAVRLMRRMRHGFSIVRRTLISNTSRGGAPLSGPEKSHGEAAIIREHLGGFSLLNGDRKMADDGKQQAQPPEAPSTDHSRSLIRHRGRRWRRSSGMVHSSILLSVHPLSLP